jgi:hypothetical protein
MKYECMEYLQALVQCMKYECMIVWGTCNSGSVISATMPASYGKHLVDGIQAWKVAGTSQVNVWIWANYCTWSLLTDPLPPRTLERT